MPPQIGCRTCKKLSQAAFMEPVSEENTKSVLHIRYCVLIAIVAAILVFVAN